MAPMRAWEALEGSLTAQVKRFHNIPHRKLILTNRYASESEPLRIGFASTIFSDMVYATAVPITTPPAKFAVPAN